MPHTLKESISIGLTIPQKGTNSKERGNWHIFIYVIFHDFKMNNYGK